MKRGLRTLALIGAWVLLSEILSFAAGSVLVGRGFVGRARAQRVAILDPRGAASQDGPADLKTPASIDYYAIHPFLGFVADPASTQGPVRDASGALEVTDLGFFRRTKSETRDASKLIRVAVFGGSAAFLFGFGSADRFQQLLAAGGDGEEREFAVETYAIPGYKQPQQLYALEYLLLMGKRFDVVLNLDGFNEIALGPTENVPQGTAAIYPRSWGHLVQQVPSPMVLAVAARLVVLREVRRAAASALSVPVVDSSSTAALVWYAIDRMVSPPIRDAETAMVNTANGAAGYASTGPPATQEDGDRALVDLVTIWKNSSLLMEQVCLANHIAYIHALQPNQYLPGSKPMGAVERAAAFREDSSYRHLVEAGYPQMIAAGDELRKLGVNFIDLTGAFTEISDQIYVDDFCHVNPRGNQILAERLAPIVRSSLR